MFFRGQFYEAGVPAPGFSIYSCFVGVTHFFAPIHRNVDDDVSWLWGAGLFVTVLF